ncbi:MAG: FHA domain-containing protein [Myxococcota bacterium]
MLRQLPSGPVFVLDDFEFEGMQRRWLSVGSDEQHITISGKHPETDRETVSKLQCVLFRERETGRLFVMDADAKNPTRVNGVPVADGEVEVHSGTIVELGAARLLACGRAGEQQKAQIVAEDLHQYLQETVAVHGAIRRAADALSLSHSTLLRWLRTGKFSAAHSKSNESR